MSEKHYKDMPGGTWIFLRNLPVGATDETVSAYLRERGLDIGAECISLKVWEGDNPTASALVAVKPDVVGLLVDWVLNGEPFEGRVPRVELSRRDAARCAR